MDDIDLRTLSTEELDELKERTIKEISRYDNKQHAIKILLNSVFGALGNKFFRYYDIRIAEAITVTGQIAIRWTERTLNEYLNKILKTQKDYVVAIDTDSTLIIMDDFVDKFNPVKPVDFLDIIAKDKLEPVIKTAMDDLNDNVFCGMKQRLSMKREVIAAGFFVSKKHYAMKIYDNEGIRYSTPKLKIKGISAVKSSTPKAIRNSMKNVFNIILDGDKQKTIQYIDQTRRMFMEIPLEKIASPRGVNNIEKWLDVDGFTYKKRTPIQVRSAILYNNELVHRQLTNKYRKIRSGDKIKFIYLTMPNPLGENVIGFPNKLPEEFDLDQYVDYGKAFDKTFLDTVDPIMKTIGWGSTKGSDEIKTNDFFS